MDDIPHVSCCTIHYGPEQENLCWSFSGTGAMRAVARVQNGILQLRGIELSGIEEICLL